MASLWNEYLCLVPGEIEPYKLFIAQYEALAEAIDYFDEELEDYVLPAEIDSKQVVGVEDDYVTGGELVYQECSDTVEFTSVFDPSVEAWLDKNYWTRHGVLSKIESEITQNF